jgi:FlaA1/EpsC-like NDP-sugar epimerase
MTIRIAGCGAQGRVIPDILRAARPGEDIEFVDDDQSLWGKSIDGARVIGGLDRALTGDPAVIEMIVALGNPELRLSIAERITVQASASPTRFIPPPS